MRNAKVEMQMEIEGVKIVFRRWAKAKTRARYNKWVRNPLATCLVVR